MWRALFLAIAISVCFLGLECLVVKRATLTIKGAPPAATSVDYSFLDPSFAAPPPPPAAAKRVIEPPEWAPFGLLSVGVIMLLYSKSFG